MLLCFSLSSLAPFLSPSPSSIALCSLFRRLGAFHIALCGRQSPRLNVILQRSGLLSRRNLGPLLSQQPRPEGAGRISHLAHTRAYNGDRRGFIRPLIATGPATRGCWQQARWSLMGPSYNIKHRPCRLAFRRATYMMFDVLIHHYMVALAAELACFYKSDTLG